ncbi:MAG: helix-turn-helix transcriptional regulator [Lachnospiraceae bacterium]|nr:helix-turn-helix transcriptional regulator [Lachnospiraceae bacterium]
MIAERIKFLRERNAYTQTELAKKLGITRSSVNAWEMGISVPSTQYIVELSTIFSVSTDYLLGVEKTSTIDLNGLSETDIEMVYTLAEYLKTKNRR